MYKSLSLILALCLCACGESNLPRENPYAPYVLSMTESSVEISFNKQDNKADVEELANKDCAIYNRIAKLVHIRYISYGTGIALYACLVERT
jgi:hypothetical protein